jgi:hypothetical protein
MSMIKNTYFDVINQREECEDLDYQYEKYMREQEAMYELQMIEENQKNVKKNDNQNETYRR